MDRALNHSIQNIFIQVGQYDRYAIFDFWYGSDAFQKYGNIVYGFVLYSPLLRAGLKQQIESGQIGDDDGIVILDGALQSKTKNDLLRKEGFKASDICRLSTLDIGPVSNQYDNLSIKMIPNTIDVKVDMSGFQGEQMELLIFKKRVEAGIPLILEETRRFLSLQLLLEPEQLTEEDKQKVLTNPVTGRFYDDVWIAALSPIFKSDRSPGPIKTILNSALANRRKERVAFICRHLGVALKHINNLKTQNLVAWQELMQLVYGFEAETITLWGWARHVYWDFERFIHIYLRHYKNFLIHESSRGQGTGFQYTLKDIRRIITIILEANKKEIENQLRAGKGFHLQEEKGFYYNGNYYSLKIDPDGRLMKFHPQDNNK